MSLSAPCFLLILDGVADTPQESLNHQTPLEAAHLPTFDFLASSGICGLADPIAPNTVASTPEGTMAIFGYNPLQYPIGRGVIEAIGTGISLQTNDIALRGNWATLSADATTIMDRRAGRIREGTSDLVESINQIEFMGEISIHVQKATEHRVAIVLRGSGLSDQFTGSDPSDHHPHGKRLVPRAFDSGNRNAIKTSQVLNQYELEVQRILQHHPVNQQRIKNQLLPANALLTRSPGFYKELPPLSYQQKRLRGVCISGEQTIIGIAKMTGMDTISQSSMTANLDTDLEAKFEMALQSLDKYDIVALHIKGCDIAAHNLEPIRKKDFLEKIDCSLSRFLDRSPASLVMGIVSDHATSSSTGTHIEQPVPVILYAQHLEKDTVCQFTEYTTKHGKLGRLPMHQVFSRLLQLVI